MKPALLSLIILLSAPTGLRAEPQDSGDAEEGFIFAKAVCANCHAIVSDETSPSPEAPTFDEIAEQSGMSAKSIVERIQAVHPKMPNIPMERQELIDLAAYILSSDNGE